PEWVSTSSHAIVRSGLTLRESRGDAPLCTIDVRSYGFGTGDPTPLPTEHGAGALTGGTLPAIAYTSQSRQWGPTPAALVRNRLDIVAKNISSLTIDPSRADVTCGAALDVKTDGPVSVTLTGCGRTETFG